jgi:hypothetical protein
VIDSAHDALVGVTVDGSVSTPGYATAECGDSPCEDFLYTGVRVERSRSRGATLLFVPDDPPGSVRFAGAYFTAEVFGVDRPARVCRHWYTDSAAPDEPVAGVDCATCGEIQLSASPNDASRPLHGTIDVLLDETRIRLTF